MDLQGQHHRARGAFTLIELLVVIAIISLLAAILFPVFGRARENARRASCASNMKQVALALRQYIDDSDGRLMNATPDGSSAQGKTWDPVQPYIKNSQSLLCPSAPSFKDPWAPGNAWRATHYGFPVNWAGTQWFICTVVRLKTPTYTSSVFTSPPLQDAIVEPARTCLFAEVGNKTNANYLTNGWGNPLFYADDVLNTTVGPLYPDRHLEGANYAYMDGHVKWIKKEAALESFQAQSLYATGSARSDGITAANAGNYPIVFAWKR